MRFKFSNTERRLNHLLRQERERNAALQHQLENALEVAHKQCWLVSDQNKYIQELESKLRGRETA